MLYQQLVCIPSQTSIVNNYSNSLIIFDTPNTHTLEIRFSEDSLSQLNSMISGLMEVQNRLIRVRKTNIISQLNNLNQFNQADSEEPIPF